MIKCRELGTPSPPASNCLPLDQSLGTACHHSQPRVSMLSFPHHSPPTCNPGPTWRNRSPKADVGAIGSAGPLLACSLSEVDASYHCMPGTTSRPTHQGLPSLQLAHSPSPPPGSPWPDAWGIRRGPGGIALPPGYTVVSSLGPGANQRAGGGGGGCCLPSLVSAAIHGD